MKKQVNLFLPRRLLLWFACLPISTFWLHKEGMWFSIALTQNLLQVALVLKEQYYLRSVDHSGVFKGKGYTGIVAIKSKLAIKISTLMKMAEWVLYQRPVECGVNQMESMETHHDSNPWSLVHRWDGKLPKNNHHIKTKWHEHNALYLVVSYNMHRSEHCFWLLLMHLLLFSPPPAIYLNVKWFHFPLLFSEGFTVPCVNEVYKGLNDWWNLCT